MLLPTLSEDSVNEGNTNAVFLSEPAKVVGWVTVDGTQAPVEWTIDSDTSLTLLPVSKNTLPSEAFSIVVFRKNGE
jgi:hypothetical protein